MIGSSRAALNAGYAPAIIPISDETISASKMYPIVIVMVIDASAVIKTVTPHESSSPRMPLPGIEIRGRDVERAAAAAGIRR